MPRRTCRPHRSLSTAAADADALLPAKPRHMYVYVYTYMLYTHAYTYTYIYLHIHIIYTYQEGIRNRTGQVEAKRTEMLVSEPAETVRGTEPNRTGPSHDAPEKRRPNRIEPENYFSDPNRIEPVNFRKVRNRTQPNPTDSFLA